MSKFFIDRPIFAWVIALVIMLVGGLSILKLPINQYPSIAPPAIAIAVSYPGASAQTVQDTVVQVIEQPSLVDLLAFGFDLHAEPIIGRCLQSNSLPISVKKNVRMHIIWIPWY